MENPLIFLLILLGLISAPIEEIDINTSAISDKLIIDFYKSTCPNAQQIVSDVITKQSQENEGIIPGIIRLHFHDCHVTGCDASILLTPQRYNSLNSEMAHPANSISLRGMDALEQAKAEIEKQCPGVVSCADILAFAARDAVVLSGNPKYEVPAGRRDSLATDGSLANDLPKGNRTIDDLIKSFAQRGLSREELVVLDGAHSIGQTRCLNTIADSDSLVGLDDAANLVDRKFQQMIKRKFCPESQKDLFWNMTTPLVPAKPDISNWGVTYYENMLNGKSLIPSDIALAVDPRTKEIVEYYASHHAKWQKKFNEAMIKMGKINVLTGDQGEIRKTCRWINAVNTA
ncbi:peroxidase 5-like [Amaranthus tricolor]|uniref:peroxidase 5-like n=1 Tax=Amaranthus tricolor TaxID=29722 RepID=UPI00258D9C57|nr:peroxidase 5-like [Amaranthus tricolor]